jgi:hypothetical protein
MGRSNQQAQNTNKEREAEKAQAEALLLQQQEASRIKALEEHETKLKSLYEAAQSRFAEKDWAGAGEILVNLQGLQSDYLDVADLIIRVQEEQEQEKREAEKAQAEALLLQQQEVARKKALEERQTQLKSLYDGAHARIAERDWAEAAKLLENIQEMQPDYLDVADLLKQAQEGQEQEKRQVEENRKRQEEENRRRQAEEARQAELSRLYHQADEAAKAGNCQKPSKALKMS